METVIIILGIIIVALVWLLAINIRISDYYKQLNEMQKFDIDKLKNEIKNL
jgi:hypothetical protein